MNVNLINHNKDNKIDFKKLRKNDLIKLDDGEETFWAIVDKKLRNCVLAKIDNKLLFEKKYNYGDVIKCKNENILDFNIDESYDLVISNLPYNISSQVLVKLSSLKNRPRNMILMFQKEFATRLLDIDLNSINALINCFYNVKLKFNVSKNCFRPIPKVNSSILTFIKKEKCLLDEDEIDSYIKFKRKLFTHKRKTLKNLLKEYTIKGDFDLNLRVEKLKLPSLINIFREVNA